MRGVPYQGPKHDYSQEPQYVVRSEAVERAILAGQLLHIDGTVAAIVYQHNRQTYRGRDKSRRITMPEIANKAGCSVETVKRSIARLLAAGVMQVESEGQHNRNGTIYRFPTRSEESRDLSTSSDLRR